VNTERGNIFMGRNKASTAKKKGASRQGSFKTFADRFDERTRANMEVALERACEYLQMGRDAHEARRRIAQRIMASAEGGERTLTGLTKAGRDAATELSGMQDRPQ